MDDSKIRPALTAILVTAFREQLAAMDVDELVDAVADLSAAESAGVEPDDAEPSPSAAQPKRRRRRKSTTPRDRATGPDPTFAGGPLL